MQIALTPKQEQQLATLAHNADRSAEELLAQLVGEVLAESAEDAEMLARADARIFAGRTFSHEEVGNRLRARLTSR